MDLSSVTARPATPGRRFLSPANTGLVLALVLTSQLMVVLDATIVNIALHDIKASLHFSDAGLSWVINAYTLTFGGLLLLGARAGDLLGRRTVFLAGIGLFTLASLVGGFAQNPSELLIARAVQGVGGALASPSALAVLMAMFPEARERTRAIGLYTAVSVGGAALGLIAGGMLSEWASWRWVLFVNVPIGLVLLVLGRPALPTLPGQHGRFDLAGAVTSTLGMTALVYGFVHAADSGWANAVTIGSFVAGLALMAIFIAIESRVESPITPLHVLVDRNRATAYVGRLLLTAAMMGMFFFLTQFLRGVLGYSDVRTGFAFVPMTIAVFTASQLSARVFVERFGGRPVLIAGMLTSTLGLLWLTQLGEHSSYWSLFGPLVLFGFGNGTSFVPLTTAGLDGVAAKDAGAASGLVNVMQQVGGSLGLAILVTVYGSATSHASKHVDLGLSAAEAAKHVFVTGADRAFWMATILLAAAWALVVVALRPRRERDGDGVDQDEVDLEFSAALEAV